MADATERQSWPATERRTPTSQRNRSRATRAARAPRAGRDVSTYEQLASATLFQRDSLEHVCDRLACVDGRLERLEDVLPADHDHRVDPAGEQRCDAVSLQAVAFVLQAMDLDEMRADLGTGAQRAQRLS